MVVTMEDKVMVVEPMELVEPGALQALGSMLLEELCHVTLAETVGEVAEKQCNRDHRKSKHLVGFIISRNSS
jgi:hypothetical protein